MNYETIFTNFRSNIALLNDGKNYSESLINEICHEIFREHIVKIKFLREIEDYRVE